MDEPCFPEISLVTPSVLPPSAMGQDPGEQAELSLLA